MVFRDFICWTPDRDLFSLPLMNYYCLPITWLLRPLGLHSAHVSLVASSGYAGRDCCSVALMLRGLINITNYKLKSPRL